MTTTSIEKKTLTGAERLVEAFEGFKAGRLEYVDSSGNRRSKSISNLLLLNEKLEQAQPLVEKTQNPYLIQRFKFAAEKARGQFKEKIEDVPQPSPFKKMDEAHKLVKAFEGFDGKKLEYIDLSGNARTKSIPTLAALEETLDKASIVIEGTKSEHLKNRFNEAAKKARGQFAQIIEKTPVLEKQTQIQGKTPSQVQALFPGEPLVDIKFMAESPLGLRQIRTSAAISVRGSCLLSLAFGALHYASFRHIPWFIPFNAQRSLQGLGFMTVLKTLKHYVKEGHQTYIQNGDIPKKDENAPSFIRWLPFLDGTQKCALQFAPLKVGVEATLTQGDKTETIVFSIQPREDKKGCDYEVVNGDVGTTDIYQQLEKMTAAFDSKKPISYQMKFYRSTKEIPETPQPSRLSRIANDISDSISWAWNHKKTMIALIAAEALAYTSANYCQSAADLGAVCGSINFMAEYIPTLSGIANRCLPSPEDFLSSLHSHFILTGMFPLICEMITQPEKLVEDAQSLIPWISKHEKQEPIQQIAKAVDMTPELEKFAAEQMKFREMRAAQNNPAPNQLDRPG